MSGNRERGSGGSGGGAGRRARQKEKRAETSRANRRRATRTRLKAYAITAVIGIVLISGLVLVKVRSKTLPPTSFGPGHSEALPPQQINSNPIPRPIQEHLMERTPGHPPGRMLVQYNCVQYECESDLVRNLESIVAAFPPSVYLAPYPGMDAKIALAAPGRLQTLDEFDADRLRSFIRENLNR